MWRPHKALGKGQEFHSAGLGLGFYKVPGLAWEHLFNKNNVCPCPRRESQLLDSSLERIHPWTLACLASEPTLNLSLVELTPTHPWRRPGEF